MLDAAANGPHNHTYAATRCCVRGTEGRTTARGSHSIPGTASREQRGPRRTPPQSDPHGIRREPPMKKTVALLAMLLLGYGLVSAPARGDDVPHLEFVRALRARNY